MKSDDFLLLDIQLKNKLYNVQILPPPLSYCEAEYDKLTVLSL